MHSSSTRYEKLKKNNCCSRFHSYFLISPNARIYNAKLHCWSSIEDERRRHLDSFPWTIHPYSSFRWCWMSFMLMTLIFSLIGHRPIHPYDWIAYGFTTLTFMVDIVFHFRTGYPLDLQHSSKVAELNPKLIAKHYAKSWFVIDLVSAIPFELISTLFGDADESNGVLSAFISTLRLLKLFRLARILHYGSKILKRGYMDSNHSAVVPQCWKPPSQPCPSCFPPPHHIAIRRFEFDDDIITITEDEEEDDVSFDESVQVGTCPASSTDEGVVTSGDESDGSMSKYNSTESLVCYGLDSAA